MVISRRDAFGSLAVLLELAASSAQAQQPGAAAPAPPPVFKHDLPNLTMDGWEVTASYVDYPPGRVGQAHRHPGFVVVYVLEGAMVTRVVGEGVPDVERTYRAGEMFYEPPGATHQVSRNASDTQPARMLAMIFAKKGSPQVMPA